MASAKADLLATVAGLFRADLEEVVAAVKAKLGDTRDRAEADVILEAADGNKVAVIKCLQT
ncbi:hypothetical protein ACIRYZ_41925 [Kitasatospora sp. NPDC101155]|uniref:hypothetical protein n=1 Tax=Kitasatospora sp. NPDC101155 TaxID=3364097 RepID=UPI00381754BF